jgi:hypothetical protein
MPRGPRGENVARAFSGLPAALGGLPSNFLSPLRRHAFRPRLPAHAAQRDGSGVLAVLRSDVLNLAGRDLGDPDDVADSVGGAFFALGPRGITTPPLGLG